MNNILYIGLHGYAGSGKDTVAKALRLMLSYPWETFDDFKKTWEQEAFKRHYATFSDTVSNATFYDNYDPTLGGNASLEDAKVYCIAFADQLKYMCAEMFGIPVKHFYYNKENAWIDISGTFEYVEKLPYGATTVTAENYAYMMNSNTSPEKPLWMSLREVLVYVGTYICQAFINKDIFTNGVNNKVKMVAARNKGLEYVICTDVRFYHEIDFICKHHGINIDIRRPEVKQLDNIAEHEFDSEEDTFDLVIDNDSTYDQLMRHLWETVHENVIFKNETYNIPSIDGTQNYLRRISNDEWQACFENGVDKCSWNMGDISSVTPTGSNAIKVGDILPMGEVQSIIYNDRNHVIKIS